MEHFLIPLDFVCHRKKQTANEINEVPQLIHILLMTITDKQQINKCRVQYTECLAFIVVGI